MEPFTEHEPIGADGQPTVINGGGRFFQNDRYSVIARDFMADDGEPMRWLSIRRNDRGVVDDWRDLQRVKNMLAGPGLDAVQVFPRESNLADSANQYHLWVYLDAAHVLPFGFKDRCVQGSAAASDTGAKQRQFA